MLTQFYEVWLSPSSSALIQTHIVLHSIRCICILAEHCWLWWKKIDNFSWEETRVTIGLLIVNLICAALANRYIGAVYSYFYEHRIISLDTSSIWAFVFAFVTIDFIYYWQHRALHGLRWFWVNHVVHHTPTKYNLTLVYRVGFTHYICLSWAFWLILPLIGFTPIQAGIAFAFQQFFMFWQHTEVIPAIPVFDWLIMTPEQHQIHHGKNPQYINKNFAGVFIVFDRIFGTFQKHIPGIPVEYGVVNQPKETFIDISFSEWRRLLNDILKWGLNARRRRVVESNDSRPAVL